MSNRISTRKSSLKPYKLFFKKGNRDGPERVTRKEMGRKRRREVQGESVKDFGPGTGEYYFPPTDELSSSY